MNRRSAAALLVAGLASVAACGGTEEGAKPVPPSSVTSAVPTPTSERLTSTDPVPQVEPDEPVLPPTTPTTSGALPPSLGIPGANEISLGSGSSIVNSFTVSVVPFDQVVAFVFESLADDGWAAALASSDVPGLVLVEFSGPGAQGEVRIAPDQQDPVLTRVRVQLGG